MEEIWWFKPQSFRCGVESHPMEGKEVGSWADYSSIPGHHLQAPFTWALVTFSVTGTIFSISHTVQIKSDNTCKYAGRDSMNFLNPFLYFLRKTEARYIGCGRDGRKRMGLRKLVENEIVDIPDWWKHWGLHWWATMSLSRQHCKVCPCGLLFLKFSIPGGQVQQVESCSPTVEISRMCDGITEGQGTGDSG